MRAGDTVAVAPEGIIATVKAVRVVSHVSGSGGAADARDQVAFAGDAADVGLDLPDASRLVPGTVLCIRFVPARARGGAALGRDSGRWARCACRCSWSSSVVVHAYASSTAAPTRLVSSLDKARGRAPDAPAVRVVAAAVAAPASKPTLALLSPVERFEDYRSWAGCSLRRDGATVALGVVVETFAH